MAIKLILGEMGATKVIKDITPNKGQKPMYQGIRYSESPLYWERVTVGKIILSVYIFGNSSVYGQIIIYGISMYNHEIA